MLNKNKILIAGVVGGIAVAVPNMAKALYQCLPCPANTFAKKGTVGDLNSCTYITSMTTSYFSKKYEVVGGSSCKTGNIKKGYPYKVVLAGGNGGNCKNDNYSVGGKGGYLEYNFIAHADGSFELCAGQKGYSNDDGKKLCGYERFYKSGAGGGAGSFLRLAIGGTNYYFVAGGGGGCLNGDDSSAGGGGGGGIGAGGAGGVGGNNCDGPGAPGGSIVGKYNGGAEQCPYNNQANAGSGLNNGVIGPSCLAGGSGGGNGGNGGRSSSSSPMTSFFIYGLNGPDGSTSKKLGGDGGNTVHWSGYNGDTSVSSNVSASFSRRSDGQGFAYLYVIE